MTSTKQTINTQLTTITLLVVLCISFITQNYTITYLSMSFFLFWVLMNFSDLNAKAITGFFFLYYFIPLPNISTYRGTIVYTTLYLYTIMLLLAVLPLIFKFYIKRKAQKKRYVVINSHFKSMVSIHLCFVYLLVLFIYLKYGLVVVNQEIRFKIPTILGYLVKSSIYIPLFSVFFNRNKFSKQVIFKYIVLPLLPAIMIGSRGTVILILISVAVLLIISKIELGKTFKLKTSSVWLQYKKYVYRLGIVVLMILHFFYYSRRFFSDKLLTNMGVIKRFFQSDSPLYLPILPLYTSFRETIGLANVIVKNDYQNTTTEYPLFFAEIFTILPGKQPAPGQIVGDFIGRNLDGGLTPNLLGGLYTDFGQYSVFGGLIFVLIIIKLYKRAVFSEYYKILYVITLTQYFHLFHRGFLKPEYIMAYIIIFFYFFILKIKDENSSHSIPVIT